MSAEEVEVGRVRIWDKEWNCLIDERAEDGDTASDVVQRAVSRLTFNDEKPPLAGR